MKSLKKNKIFYILFAIYVICTAYFLADYILADPKMMIGFLVIPFVYQPINGKSNKYLFLSGFVVLLAISFFIKILTVFYLVGIFGIIYILSNQFGRIHNSFFYILLILSPVFKHISNLFGFSIRLWLTEISGKILGFTNQKIFIEGNMILINGNDFTVDPVCIGLNMMIISLVFTILIYVYYIKKTKKNPHWYVLPLLLITTFLLNILGNLIRIIILVGFTIMPNQIMHEITGLICLFVYVIVPIVFITDKIFKKTKKTLQIATTQKINPIHFIIYGLIVTAFIFSGINIKYFKDSTTATTKEWNFESCTKKIVKEGIIQFDKDNLLIYVKPLASFYVGEHNPMICWTGSGYKFKKIEKITIKKQQLYKGVLEKGNEKIYAIWWFDNGKTITINQLIWRTKMLKGENAFSLVNFNSADENKLETEVNKYLSNR